MSEAPERIWAWGFQRMISDSGFYDGPCHWMGSDFREFVRADLVAAQAAEITRLRAKVEALQSERPFIVGANHGYETAMEQVAEEARRYASHYGEATDGRNTFVLFAEWAERAALATYHASKGEAG